jgi:hypothetical protein
MVGSVMVGSVTGFGISLITLLGLEGYNLLAFHPARMFLLVRSLSLCRAVWIGEMLLADCTYTSSLQSVNLVTIGCFQRGNAEYNVYHTRNCEESGRYLLL